MKRPFLACAVVGALSTSCTPAQRAGIPVINTIDKVGTAAAKVLGWCEASGAEPSRIVEIVRDFRTPDEEARIRATIATVNLALDIAESTGREPPAEIREAMRTVVGYAIQNGLRSLKG